MPTWLRLLTLTDDGIKAIRQSTTRTFSGMDEIVRSFDCKITHAWVTLGEMDMATVIDAPSEERFHAMEDALSTRGIYTSTTIPAIPMEEFLKITGSTGNFGMFLESWIGQRRAALNAANTGPEEKGPKARSKKRTRQPGVDDRKSLRANLPSAAGGAVIFADLVPPVRARITSLGHAGDKGSLSTRITLADSARMRAADWPVGHDLTLALELPDDPAKIPVKGKVVRVDDVAGGKDVDIGVSYAGLSPTHATRLTGFFRKHTR